MARARDETVTVEVDEATKAKQIEWESRRRAKLGVPTLAAAVVYLISEIIGGEALHGVPDAGVIQGLGPALNGVAVPATSPRAGEVIFISHHAFGLVAGGALAAIAVTLATFAVVFLYDAARFRRPQTLPAGRPLAMFGGFAVAGVSLAGQIVNAVATHNFATSLNHSNAAVDSALTTGTARVIIEYAALVAGLAFAIGVVVASLNAMRTGLVHKLLGYMGMIAAVLFVLPLGQTLSLISTLWLAGLGLLYLGRWPNGDPEAWAAGEARPWPSGAAMRQARIDQAQATRGGDGASNGVAPASPAGGFGRRKALRRGGAGTGGGDGGRRAARADGTAARELQEAQAQARRKPLSASARPARPKPLTAGTRPARRLARPGRSLAERRTRPCRAAQLPVRARVPAWGSAARDTLPLVAGATSRPRISLSSSKGGFHGGSITTRVRSGAG